MVDLSQKNTPKLSNLKTNEVHIWQLDLRGLPEKWDESILSDYESERINRLRLPQHRVRALAMKVQLRQLLAQYLLVSPSDLLFKKTEFGKPRLVKSTLSFNVSHSGDTGLVAVSLCEEIGVDIENWRAIDNREAIVQRHFSEKEKIQWLDVIEEDKEVIFFKIWTCKEAFIKATGRGLGLGLSLCSFDILHSHNLLSCPAEFGDASEWSCVSIPVQNRTSASLMIHAENCHTVFNKFLPEIFH